MQLATRHVGETAKIRKEVLHGGNQKGSVVEK